MLTLIRRAPLAAAAALALTGAVAVPVAGAAPSAKPKPVVKKVKVADDFYSPTKLTIKVGDKVNFVWSQTNVDVAQRDACLRSQGRQQEAVHVA